MKINKGLSLLLVFALVGGLACFSAVPAQAQTKITKKIIKKVITPKIMPVEEPTAEPTEETVPALTPPAPPVEQTYEIETPKENKGIFGWGLNSDLTASYMVNRAGQQGLLGLLGIRANVVFDDPLKLGSKIGLAEDAVEYNAGFGLVYGNDINNNPMFSLPLSAGAVVYLKENSLFGRTPYIGGGLNYNLIGSDSRGSGLGGQLYTGILVDLGLEWGKAGVSIGYSSHKVDPIRIAEGIFISLTQPFKL